MKKIHPLAVFDGLYYSAGEREQRARWKILHRLSWQFYFHLKAYIILQTIPVCNAYAQINLLSDKGKTDRKNRTATAQWANFTEATTTEVKHDLVCAFIEVIAVYRFCYKPNLTVLKSCMMLSRSSIMVLCFGRDLYQFISSRKFTWRFAYT